MAKAQALLDNVCVKPCTPLLHLSYVAHESAVLIFIGRQTSGHETQGSGPGIDPQA